VHLERFELLSCPKTRLWFVKTLDTFGSFEISNLEAHELGERWCNNVTSARHFERHGIFGDHSLISFHSLLRKLTVEFLDTTRDGLRSFIHLLNICGRFSFAVVDSQKSHLKWGR
jgi:hypothetical protein